MSIPGTDLGNTWEGASNSGGSEGGSLHCSSEEQIYFYMPSLNTARTQGHRVVVFMVQ